MATPSYYRGKTPSRTAIARRKKQQSSDLAMRNPMAFGKTLLIGGGVSLGLIVAAIFAIQWIHSGRLGVWTTWHGDMWETKHLVNYLRGQGLQFEVIDVDKVPSSKAGVVQLAFDGFEEAVTKAAAVDDVVMRYHAVKQARSSSHSVFIVRHDPGSGGRPLADIPIGGSWTWGQFVFRGDSRHIEEIREAIEGI